MVSESREEKNLQSGREESAYQKSEKLKMLKRKMLETKIFDEKAKAKEALDQDCFEMLETISLRLINLRDHLRSL